MGGRTIGRHDSHLDKPVEPPGPGAKLWAGSVTTVAGRGGNATERGAQGTTLFCTTIFHLKGVVLRREGEGEWGCGSQA